MAFKATNLLDLPSEILSQILYHLPYSSLSAFGQSSHLAQGLILPNNQAVWQSAYLKVFDDPRKRHGSVSNKSGPEKWYSDLKARVIAVKLLDADSGTITTRIEAEELVQQILNIIDTAKFEPTESELAAGITPLIDDRTLSANLTLLPTNYNFSHAFDSIVRGTMLFSDDMDPIDSGTIPGANSSVNMPGAFTPTASRPMTRLHTSLLADRQPRSKQAARLHCLAGYTTLEDDDIRAAGRARRIVYDWDLTNERNEWAPLKDDRSGEVDWHRLEAIVTVVSKQFFKAVRYRMVPPMGFCYSLPHRTLIGGWQEYADVVDGKVTQNRTQDWARVAGNWCGTYVFLHWEDLVHFNTAEQQGRTRDRSMLEDPPEACGGLMKLEIKLNMALRHDPRLQSESPRHVDEEHPPLYFSGISRSYDFQMATEIRGSCWLCPGGREVRWKFIVHYSGSDQWLLEGVQPGGIRSGCVYGVWTSVDHSPGGPVGPFIYCPDELCKSTSVVLQRAAGAMASAAGQATAGATVDNNDSDDE